MAKRFKTLSDEEIVKVIAHVEDYGCRKENRKVMLTALYALLANTGLRVSEAVAYTKGTTVYPHALRWSKLDFERGEVTVVTLKQQRTKGRRPETFEDTIPLDAGTLAALQAWRAVSPLSRPHDPVFPLSRRVAYNIWQKLLHLACIRPVKLHCLRHSAITRWLEDTQDLAFAQHLARHRSVTSTAKYVHVTRLRQKFDGCRKIALPPIVGGPERPSSPPPAPPIGAPGSQDALAARLARIEAMLLNLGKPQVNGKETEAAERPAGA